MQLIIISNVESNQLISVFSKIIRKPINPSRKEKKSLQFGHDHETKLGDYYKVSCIHNLITPTKILIAHISKVENLEHVELIFVYIVNLTLYIHKYYAKCCKSRSDT